MAQSTRNFRGSIPHAQFFLRLPCSSDYHNFLSTSQVDTFDTISAPLD